MKMISKTLAGMFSLILIALMWLLAPLYRVNPERVEKIGRKIGNWILSH